MQEENLSILRSLKQNIEEISVPLDTAQTEVLGENTDKVQKASDLIMGELTMIVLLLMGTDSEISTQELELLNDMRHVVYGYGIPELNSNDYAELCQKFLHLYPERKLTLDHLPSSIRLLTIYEKTHRTAFAVNARTLFIQFAEAIVKADKREDAVEAMILANFLDILNAV